MSLRETRLRCNRRCAFSESSEGGRVPTSYPSRAVSFLADLVVGQIYRGRRGRLRKLPISRNYTYLN
jgi:hypothetical protein